MIDLQKPPRGSHATVKTRNRRVEAKLGRLIRDLCVIRDGYCRYALDAWGIPPGGQMFVCLEECRGRSEWAHLEEWKRFKTRGKAPEDRHCTQGSAMLCTFHHQEYDAGRLTLMFLSELGADGPVAWERA